MIAWENKPKTDAPRGPEFLSRGLPSSDWKERAKNLTGGVVFLLRDRPVTIVPARAQVFCGDGEHRTRPPPS